MLAVETVRGLIAAKMTSLGQTVALDRDQFDAITEPELPATLVDKHGLVEITRLEGMAGGAAYHSTSFMLTFAAIDDAEAQSAFSAAITAFSDDYNLGGQVSEVWPMNYGEDENGGEDISAITLELGARFCTPPNDYSTLLT